jgi:hypothetical protein
MGVHEKGVSATGTPCHFLRYGTHKEEYTYQVGKITFIVRPVYKENGESMEDILLKLMLAELEPA